MTIKIPWFGRYLNVVIDISWQPYGIRYFGQNGFQTSGFDTDQILEAINSALPEDGKLTVGGPTPFMDKIRRDAKS